MKDQTSGADKPMFFFLQSANPAYNTLEEDYNEIILNNYSIFYKPLQETPADTQMLFNNFYTTGYFDFNLDMMNKTILFLEQTVSYLYQVLFNNLLMSVRQLENCFLQNSQIFKFLWDSCSDESRIHKEQVHFLFLLKQNLKASLIFYYMLLLSLKQILSNQALILNWMREIRDANLFRLHRLAMEKEAARAFTEGEDMPCTRPLVEITDHLDEISNESNDFCPVNHIQRIVNQTTDELTLGRPAPSVENTSSQLVNTGITRGNLRRIMIKFTYLNIVRLTIKKNQLRNPVDESANTRLQQIVLLLKQKLTEQHEDFVCLSSLHLPETDMGTLFRWIRELNFKALLAPLDEQGKSQLVIILNPNSDNNINFYSEYDGHRNGNILILKYRMCILLLCYINGHDNPEYQKLYKELQEEFMSQRRLHPTIPIFIVGDLNAVIEKNDRFSNVLIDLGYASNSTAVSQFVYKDKLLHELIKDCRLASLIHKKSHFGTLTGEYNRISTSNATPSHKIIEIPAFSYLHTVSTKKTLARHIDPAYWTKKEWSSISASLIDHVLYETDMVGSTVAPVTLNLTNSSVNVELTQCQLSDHLMISCNLECQVDTSKIKSEKTKYNSSISIRKRISGKFLKNASKKLDAPLSDLFDAQLLESGFSEDMEFPDSLDTEQWNLITQALQETVAKTSLTIARKARPKDSERRTLLKTSTNFMRKHRCLTNIKKSTQKYFGILLQTNNIKLNNLSSATATEVPLPSSSVLTLQNNVKLDLSRNNNVNIPTEELNWIQSFFEKFQRGHRIITSVPLSVNTIRKIIDFCDLQLTDCALSSVDAHHQIIQHDCKKKSKQLEEDFIHDPKKYHNIYRPLLYSNYLHTAPSRTVHFSSNENIPGLMRIYLKDTLYKSSGALNLSDGNTVTWVNYLEHVQTLFESKYPNERRNRDITFRKKTSDVEISNLTKTSFHWTKATDGNGITPIVINEVPTISRSVCGIIDAELASQTKMNNNDNTTVMAISKDETSNVEEPNSLRFISLKSLFNKGTMQIITNRLLYDTEFISMISEFQFGYIPGRSTSDAITVLKSITEDSLHFEKPLYIMTMDIQKAFDSIEIDQLRLCLRSHLFPEGTINLITEYVTSCSLTVEYDSFVSDKFHQERGIPQGCSTSGIVFAIVLDTLLQFLNENNINLGYKLGNPRLKRRVLDSKDENNLKITAIAFADDIVAFSDSMENITKVFHIINSFMDFMSMKLKPKATKIFMSKQGLIQLNRYKENGSLANIDWTTNCLCESVNGTMRTILLNYERKIEYLGVDINLDCRYGEQTETIKLIIKIVQNLRILKYGVDYESRPLTHEEIIHLFNDLITKKSEYKLKINLLSKIEFSALDRQIGIILKEILNLPKNLNTSVLYCSIGHGGLELVNIESRCHVQFMCNIIRILSSTREHRLIKDILMQRMVDMISAFLGLMINNNPNERHKTFINSIFDPTMMILDHGRDLNSNIDCSNGTQLRFLRNDFHCLLFHNLLRTLKPELQKRKERSYIWKDIFTTMELLGLEIRDRSFFLVLFCRLISRYKSLYTDNVPLVTTCEQILKKRFVFDSRINIIVLPKYSETEGKRVQFNDVVQLRLSDAKMFPSCDKAQFSKHIYEIRSNEARMSWASRQKDGYFIRNYFDDGLSFALTHRLRKPGWKTHKWFKLIDQNCLSSVSVLSFVIKSFNTVLPVREQLNHGNFGDETPSCFAYLDDDNSHSVVSCYDNSPTAVFVNHKPIADCSDEEKLTVLHSSCPLCVPIALQSPTAVQMLRTALGVNDSILTELNSVNTETREHFLLDCPVARQLCCKYAQKDEFVKLPGDVKNVVLRWLKLKGRLRECSPPYTLNLMNSIRKSRDLVQLTYTGTCVPSLSVPCTVRDTFRTNSMSFMDMAHSIPVVKNVLDDDDDKAICVISVLTIIHAMVWRFRCDVAIEQIREYKKEDLVIEF